MSYRKLKSGRPTNLAGDSGGMGDDARPSQVLLLSRSVDRRRQRRRFHLQLPLSFSCTTMPLTPYGHVLHAASIRASTLLKDGRTFLSGESAIPGNKGEKGKERREGGMALDNGIVNSPMLFVPPLSFPHPPADTRMSHVGFKSHHRPSHPSRLMKPFHGQHKSKEEGGGRLFTLSFSSFIPPRHVRDMSEKGDRDSSTELGWLSGVGGVILIICTFSSGSHSLCGEIPR